MSFISPFIPSSAAGRTGASARVEQAIQEAAHRTRNDFSFLMSQARIESGLDPAARAKSSSAAGLYQFTNQSWLETLHRHGERHGLGWAARGIAKVGGQARIVDPALSGAIMNLRHDPAAAALMAGELANDNAAFLASALGRPADHTELYLAHFLGAGGARRFIEAHEENAGQSAAPLFPQAAQANAGVFYQSGRPRSLGEVRALFADKLAAASREGPPGAAGAAGAMAHSFLPPQAAPASAATATAHPIASRGAMADLIQRTFAGGEAGKASTPAHVASAYAQFARWGL